MGEVIYSAELKEVNRVLYLEITANNGCVNKSPPLSNTDPISLGRLVAKVNPNLRDNDIHVVDKNDKSLLSSLGFFLRSYRNAIGGIKR